MHTFSESLLFAILAYKNKFTTIADLFVFLLTTQYFHNSKIWTCSKIQHLQSLLTYVSQFVGMAIVTNRSTYKKQRQTILAQA